MARPGAEPMQTLPSPPPSSPPREPTTPPVQNTRSGPVPARTVYARQANKLHPDLDPRDDFAILALGSNALENQSTAQKLEWLKDTWEDTVATYGSEASARSGIKKFLDGVVELSGEKPGPDDPEARYLPIPHSNLSLRLWPGSLADAEYCVDFVDSSTKDPLNVPDNYELWEIPDPATPWINPVSTKLSSIERIHGIDKDQIEPGAEKFILRDGLYCQLLRDKRKIMRFRVPLREQAIVSDDEEGNPLYEL